MYSPWFLHIVASQAERQLVRIYSDPGILQGLIVNAANRVFRPRSRENIQTSGLLEQCEPGMALINDSCRKWSNRACGLGGHYSTCYTGLLPYSNPHCTVSLFAFYERHMMTVQCHDRQYTTHKMLVIKSTAMGHHTKTIMAGLKT